MATQLKEGFVHNTKPKKSFVHNTEPKKVSRISYEYTTPLKGFQIRCNFWNPFFQGTIWNDLRISETLETYF